MTKVLTRDFRVTFARMADQAIINRNELAELLSMTPGAISQMGYRGELPITAFPDKRKACWFAADIRTWLDAAATRRQLATASTPATSPERPGRPRLPVLSDAERGGDLSGWSRSSN